MIGEVVFFLVVIGFFVFFFVVMPITNARMIPTAPAIITFAVGAVVILFSPLILVLFPIWGPVFGLRRIRRIVETHRQVKRCVIGAVAKEEVPVSWMSRRALTMAVWRRAGTHGWTAINRAAVAAVSDHVEARPEFQAALPEPFQPGSWFAKEVKHRHERSYRLMEHAYGMLEDREAATNGNVLQVLVSWESEMANYWLVEERRRREPSLEAIVTRIAGPGRETREPGRPAG